MARGSRTDRLLQSLGLTRDSARLVKEESHRSRQTVLQVIARVSATLEEVAQSAKSEARFAAAGRRVVPKNQPNPRTYRKVFQDIFTQVKDARFCEELNSAIKKTFGDK